jgi:hypothetical protein
MPATLTIEGKMTGRSRPLFPDWELPIPDEWGDSSAPTLRDFITRIVEAEVAAFAERRERRSLVNAMTAREIADGAAAGKVAMGGREEAEPEAPDPQVAVATALQAFSDGLFYVFVDGKHVQDLEDRVIALPDSRVTFLRLVALAGG